MIQQNRIRKILYITAGGEIVGLIFLFFMLFYLEPQEGNNPFGWIFVNLFEIQLLSSIFVLGLFRRVHLDSSMRKDNIFTTKDVKAIAVGIFFCFTLLLFLAVYLPITEPNISWRHITIFSHISAIWFIYFFMKLRICFEIVIKYKKIN